jgi:hypothetical protein
MTPASDLGQLMKRAVDLPELSLLRPGAVAWVPRKADSLTMATGPGLVTT